MLVLTLAPTRTLSYSGLIRNGTGRLTVVDCHLLKTSPFNHEALVMQTVR